LRDILMPRYDPEMLSGKVLEWLKNVGDTVSQGEPVVRIETEKVTLEVEAPETGILEKILVIPSEEDVPVGTPLGSIRAKGEAGGATDKAPVPDLSSFNANSKLSGSMKTESPTANDVNLESKQTSLGGRASPSARRLARELNVDLSFVVGTGPNGRITGEDVEKYSKTASTVGQQAPSVSSSQIPERDGKIRQLSFMRKAIGDKMYESWTRIPQVPLFLEVSLSEVDKLTKELEATSKRKISLTAILTKALSRALMQFPDLNSRYESDGVHEFEHVDVSIAVALKEGLITPVVRNADQKTIPEISSDIEELAKRARDVNLSPAEVRGGTTSISNLGGYHVDWFIPIINPPQATILGMGRARESARGTPVLTLTLVFDHRITDGARAAELLDKIRDYIESPNQLEAPSSSRG
jgi:pyruvate dehydrogenase E2 component (dihydrolipoamide acetyltransferase)